MKPISEIFLKVGVVLKDEAINQFENYINEEVRKAIADEKINGIINTITALCDAGIKESEIYRLLAEHFGIDSRSEATEYITQGRTIEFPYRKLKAYLLIQGFDRISMIKFMRSNNVREKLENNPKLCELSVEKLKIAVEKGN